MTLNDTFGPRLDALGLRIPEILLPRPGTDLQRWAIVACDQYTSDYEYWKAVEQQVGDAPSSLRLVLPEVYLGRAEVPQRIAEIHRSMQHYLEQGFLAEQTEGLVYVQRSTAHSGRRDGLLVSVDLERYDYQSGSKSLIRATEGTVVERIPPRLAVRRGAPLELPHIMVLLQDPEQGVIESWRARTHELELMYQVELMKGGGQLSGYRIADPAHLDLLLTRLEALFEAARVGQRTDQPLFWAMGDGNHSLATAKANWDEVKQAAGGNDVSSHPARWALVEIVNLHSPGLRFEPIHRVVFTKHRDALRDALARDEALGPAEPLAETELKALLAAPGGQHQAGYFDGQRFWALRGKPGGALPPARVDHLFQHFQALYPDALIDFIHGWEDAKKLALAGADAFFLPVLARERLFDYVQQHGPLPRKSFSMGDAEEKRYYMEARRITRR